MAKEKDRLTPVRYKENEITPEAIREEAYLQWLNRGCPAGDEMADWVAAERKLAAKGDWMYKKKKG